MRGGEGEPDRAAAAEELARRRARARRGRARAGSARAPAIARRPEDQVEGDHVAVRAAQLPARASSATIQPHSPEPRRETRAGGEIGRAVTQDRDQDPSQLARASRTTSRSASTTSRARRRTSPATSSTTSTRRPSRPPRSWPAGPTPRPRRSSASPRPSASTATPSCSRRRSRSTGTRSPRVAERQRRQRRGALFSFDHSEFEASLGADYSNLEETARKLTREQVEASVSALADRAAGRDRRRRPDGLLRQLPAPHCSACSTSAPRSSPHRRRVDIQQLSADRRGHAASSCSPPAAPIRSLLRAMKLARHRRARTLAITDATLSDVGEHAELTLYYSSNSPSFIRSNTALMALVQALAHGVYSRDEARPQRPHPRLQAEVGGPRRLRIRQASHRPGGRSGPAARYRGPGEDPELITPTSSDAHALRAR